MYEGNDESGRMSTIFCVKPVCFCSILELVSLLPFFLVLISIRVLVVQFHLVPQLAEKGQEGGCRSGALFSGCLSRLETCTLSLTEQGAYMRFRPW